MGAGYHGGFGATAGKILYRNDAGRENRKLNFSREDFLKLLDGITPQSTAVVQGKKDRKILMSILGDDLFENWLGVGRDTMAVARGNKIFLRYQSKSMSSDAVHEGTHAIDYITGVSPIMGSTIENELHAYREEHKFQKAAGLPLEFANDDEIIVHVFLNYRKEDKTRRKKR